MLPSSQQPVLALLWISLHGIRPIPQLAGLRRINSWQIFDSRPLDKFASLRACPLSREQKCHTFSKFN